VEWNEVEALKSQVKSLKEENEKLKEDIKSVKFCVEETICEVHRMHEANEGYVRSMLYWLG
jgi:peptidoglycan hydrolase CwlO-like protein